MNAVNVVSPLGALPRRRFAAPHPVFALALLLVALTGCSSLGREWRAAARQPAPATGIGGRWEGVWVSEVNGHRGRLRAILTPETNQVWRARFHARYAGLLTFGYTVQLHTTEAAKGEVRFEGEADLGKLAGGVYTYTGRANPTNFHATYRSRNDHGRFELRRPGP
jgi:hypothetical protein